MKVKKVSYIGIDHEQVNKHFKGELTFVNYFPIVTENGGRCTAAVYKVKNPDRSLGHKKYMLLFNQNGLMVAGRDLKELNKSRYVEAVHCLECDTVLYSIHRHDFHSCGCPNDVFVDGGTDYLRVGAMDLSKAVAITLDLLKDEVYLP